MPAIVFTVPLINATAPLFYGWNRPSHSVITRYMELLDVPRHPACLRREQTGASGARDAVGQRWMNRPKHTHELMETEHLPYITAATSTRLWMTTRG